MGFITGLFSGDKGSNFQARQVPVYSQVGSGDQAEAFNRSKQALDQQQAFLQALQGQGGVGNQQNVFQQQQMLANMLQGQAAGQGPNPAQQMLANNTGQNAQMQAALMGSQRGAGANPALLARQAAMQGAHIQQQGVGQAAALQAQQQLAAQQALMQQQGQMAQLSSQQVGQQGQALGALNSGSQSLLGGAQVGLDAYNNGRISQQNNANQANGNVAGQNAQGQSGLIGGLLGGAGSVIGGALGLAKGGAVPSEGSFLKNFASGAGQMGQNPMFTGASSLMSAFKSRQPQPTPMQAAPAPFMSQQGVLAPPPAMQQPMQMQAVPQLLASQGAVVPGTASAPGDNQENDTVPAMLSPGEIVVPRSCADDPMKAAAFAHAVAMQNHLKKRK